MNNYREIKIENNSQKHIYKCSFRSFLFDKLNPRNKTAID